MSAWGNVAVYGLSLGGSPSAVHVAIVTDDPPGQRSPDVVNGEGTGPASPSSRSDQPGTGGRRSPRLHSRRLREPALAPRRAAVTTSRMRRRAPCGRRPKGRLEHPDCEETSMDTENQGAVRGRAADARAERRARSRTAWRTWSRWLVHFGLLAFAAAALGTLQLLQIRNAIHADVGLVFASLVIVHLAQRRHRIARMFAQLRRFRRRVARELGRSVSDAILAFVTVNVVVSGILDWDRGAPLLLPLLPPPFDRWHMLSSVVLVVYLAIHVSRRWKRLRRSTIR
jgi:hypothetical protein